MREALTEAGYHPLVTGEPGEAARLVRTERPQLALLDLVLPGTDGIELMREVHGLSDLPVIFISGYGREETIVRIGGRPVEITATEYEPLRTLRVNAERVTATDALLRRVWTRR